MNKDYALRRTVLAAMNSIGEAELHQISAALGPDWLTPQKRASLRQMLRLMEREQLVMRMRVGVFRPILGRGWGGLGSDEQIVWAITGCLLECNGKMKIADVLDIFADRRVWGQNEQESQRRNILRIVMEAESLATRGDSVYSLSERPPGRVAPPVRHEPTTLGQGPHGG
jgi:hypothetical protein